MTKLLTPYDILTKNLDLNNEPNNDWHINMDELDGDEFDKMMKSIVEMVLDPNTYDTKFSTLDSESPGVFIPVLSTDNSSNIGNISSSRKKLSIDGIHKINTVLQNQTNHSQMINELVSYKSTSNEYIQDRTKRFECLKNGIPRSDWNRNRKLECHRQNRTFDSRIVIE